MHSKKVPMWAARLKHLAAIVLFVAHQLPDTLHAQTLKLATLAPEGSGWVQALRDIDAEVGRRTDGAVRFKIYPGGVQGDENVMLRKIRVGQLQGGGFGGTGISEVFPDVVALEMPFLFENYDEIDHVLEKTDAHYREGFAARGFTFLGWADIGYVHLFSQEPIRSAEDFRGMKVWRLQGEPVTEVLFEHLGVTPVPLGIPDVLLGLQTDLVEVVYASPVAALVLQWFTRVNYLTAMPINYALGALLLDGRAFERLQPEHRAIVIEVARRQMAAQMKDSRDDNEEARREIATEGVETVYPTPADVDFFRQLVKDSLPELKGRAFSVESHELVARHLHEFRQRSVRAGPQD